MRKATRRLLNMRPGSKFINKVKLLPHPDSRVGQCHKNSFAECERTPSSEFACGWVVGSYRKEIDSTPVMFHFWNIDKDGNHYDTSDMLSDTYEYVMDLDIDKASYQWSKVLGDGYLYFPPALKFKSDCLLMDVSPAEFDEQPTWPKKWIELNEGPVQIEQLLEINHQFQDSA